MKTLDPILFMFALMMSVDAMAQTTFQKTFINSSSGIQIEDRINDIILDSNQNLIFAGSSLETVSHNSFASMFQTDVNGDLRWFKNYFYYPTGNNMRSIVNMPDGNYLGLGNLYDSIGQAGTSFLMKTDSVGNIIWSKIIPFSPGTIYLEEMVSNSEYVYCAGTINNFSIGTLTDYVILKLNMNGEVLWCKSLSSLYEENLSDITFTTDNGIAFVGSSVNNNFPLDRSIYYGKIDSVGNKLWINKIDIAGVDGYDARIKECPDGGLVILSKVDTSGFGNVDLLLIKTSANGAILWSKIIGSALNDYPAELNVKSNGDLKIIGSVYDSLYNVSALSILLDSSGHVETAKTYGSNQASRFSCSLQSDNFNLYTGEVNYYPPNGLWELYMVRADSSNFTACYDIQYIINDSLFSTLAITSNDTLVGEGVVLVDITMTAVDNTNNIQDSILCFVDGMNELDINKMISIYPNPNDGNFKLLLRGGGGRQCHYL